MSRTALWSAQNRMSNEIKKSFIGKNHMPGKRRPNFISDLNMMRHKHKYSKVSVFQCGAAVVCLWKSRMNLITQTIKTESENHTESSELKSSSFLSGKITSSFQFHTPADVCLQSGRAATRGSCNIVPQQPHWLSDRPSHCRLKHYHWML